MRDWKFWLGKTVICLVTIFSLYQIYCAWTFGWVIAPIPFKTIHVSFLEHPYWFVLVLSFWFIIAVLLAALIWLEVRAQIREEKFWRKRKSSPPFDIARKHDRERRS
jgi:hypothetical protein